MYKQILMLILSVIVLYGCGNSGSDSSSSTETTSVSGSVQGLSVPNNVSIVAAKSGSSPASGSFSDAPSSGRSYATATDYASDVADTYVYDSSMEALNTVNMILCLMKQTGAKDMVNKGNYIALVNEDKCEQGQNQSSTKETGQSSGGSVAALNTWTVNSTRASNTAPQIVKIWVPGEQGNNNDPMDAQTILVEVTVNEAPGSSNPFGNFSMNFKGVVDASAFGGQSGTEATTMSGILQSVENGQNLPQFRFINLGGNRLSNNGMDFGFEEAANVIMDDASGASGKALTRKVDSYNNGNGLQTSFETNAIAFNTSHVLRGKDTDDNNTIDQQQCLSRNSFNTNVWRYNLYHAADGTFNSTNVTQGQRVSFNSGFPFTYDSDNNGSDDAHGWVGYHGVWADGNQLADGASIRKHDFQNNTSTPLTVRVAAGKLVRRTSEQTALSDFVGEELQFWGQHPSLNIFGQWLISVDSNNNFSITSTVNWGSNGRETSTTVDHDKNSQTAEVSVAAALSLADGESLWLWSDSLGGNIVYVHDSSLAANARQVTFYGEEFVSPSDSLLAGGNVTLYCYDRCLKGGLTQTNVDNANSDQDLYYTYSGTPYQYTVSASNGKVVVTDVTANAAVSATSLNLSSIGNDWGISTGEMVTTALANAAQPWDVYQASVSYRWETGSNEWNKMVTVTDASNNVLSFDPPLRFTYTHSTANDANSNADYNGKKLLLEYGGDGNLWGFPWVEEQGTHRWYSAVTLADGVQLTNDRGSFLVKAMEKEQSMQDVNVSECSALDVNSVVGDTNLALPTLNDIGTVSFTLSEKPSVTDAPAVVEGKLQKTDTP